MTEQLVKGTCLKSVVDFLQERGMLDEVVGALGPRSGEVFGTDLLSVSWYPVDAYLELLERVGDCAKPDADDLFEKLGRRIIHDGLSGVYRAFMAPTSLSLLHGLRRGHQLWNLYFRGGVFKFVELDEHNARIQVHGEERTTRAFCRTRQAGIGEALVMAGANNPQVSHARCVLRGDGLCEFDLSWTD